MALIPNAPPGLLPGMYLHLFHGRTDPEEDMDDWGSDGPTIGPLAYVHTTYATDVRICFLDTGTELQFFPPLPAVGNKPPHAAFPGPRDINFHDDMMLFDGIYYGDWSVFIVPSQ